VGLGFDYGVAVFPEDGDQKDVLIKVADERLYEMKQLNRSARHAPPAPVQRRPAIQPAAPVAPPAPAPPVTSFERSASEFASSEKRKWERVALAGTKAYAQLADDPQATARVIDLGYGGVALEMGASEQPGETFFAVLHVPILPPVRVSLKKLYEVRIAGGQVRVGCAFVT
jgi:hypothetical protein